MNKYFPHLIISLCLLLVPVFSSAATTIPPTNSTLQQYIKSLQERIVLLQAQLKQPTSSTTISGNEWRFNYSKAKIKLGIGKDEVIYDEEDIVNVFLVRNNRLYEDDKWTKNTDNDDNRIWNIFSAMAGDKFVSEYMTRYATYRLPDTGVLGFVQMLRAKEPAWGLAINAQASDFSNQKWTRDVVAVLIHEFAHVLTLNHKQIKARSKKQSSCPDNYVTLYGCSREGSYINAFANEFWNEEDFEGSEDDYEEYFEENQDDFITDYAAKSPTEDMAESFAQFVLYSKPTGNLKRDQKVLFFYRYPAFVELREHVRSVVKEYFL